MARIVIPDVPHHVTQPANTTGGQAAATAAIDSRRETSFINKRLAMRLVRERAMRKSVLCHPN
jgi:hypothetical protein